MPNDRSEWTGIAVRRTSYVRQLGVRHSFDWRVLSAGFQLAADMVRTWNVQIAAAHERMIVSESKMLGGRLEMNLGSTLA